MRHYAIQYETSHDSKGNPRSAVEIYNNDGNLTYSVRYSYKSHHVIIKNALEDYGGCVYILCTSVHITPAFYNSRFGRQPHIG